MKWINILALLGVLVVNYLANALPINGMNTGEISALYPNLFVPAGITFSIWGLIYLLLAGFVAYPFVGDNMEKYHDIAPLFLLTCALNAAWIFAWHYLYVPVSLAIMLGFLITLIVIYRRLTALPPADNKERWLLHIPFQVYLGWISVATIANFTALLVDMNFLPPGQAWWAVALIAVTQVLVYLILRNHQDAAYTLVICWALLGIVLKRQAADPVVLPVLIAAAAALALSLVFLLFLKFGKKAA